MQLKNSPWQMWATCREGVPNESTEPLVGCLGVEACTAKASGINPNAAKSGCACEWGGWGRLSVDGPGQHNPDRSEDPWGKATEVACMAVLQRAVSSGHRAGLKIRASGSHERQRKLAVLARKACLKANLEAVSGKTRHTEF
jgi:hypothetical protein